MIRWLELRRMRRAYRQLPDSHRAIFGSVRLADLDYVQTAELHGCSVEEVERTIARVLVALDRAAKGRRAGPSRHRARRALREVYADASSG